MAEPTGTARQEAERLVATVLAMASQAGLGVPAKDGEGDSAASPGLGDMISGLVGQFLGGGSGESATGNQDDRPAGADQQPDGEGSAGQQPGTQRTGAEPGGGRQSGDQQSGAASGSGRQSGDRQSGAASGSGREPGDRQSGAASGSGRQSGDQQSGDRQSGAGGLGGVWQAAGHQLWEDVGRRNGWSTGSAECCICPICRAIAGMRDPSPEQAERIATGAGDFASSVASMLRPSR